jgi:hypothetical protein
VFFLHRPGRETDAPRAALSPCVSVVPRAHGLVTGEASSRCWTAIPYEEIIFFQHEGLDCFCGLFTPRSTRAIMGDETYFLIPRREPLPDVPTYCFIGGQAHHSPPVGGAVAIWQRRCNSASAQAPHAASSAFWRSAKLRAVRMRCAQHVCRACTQF